MHPFLFNKNIDLVDFDDLKLFMFKDDNLYNIAISEDRKNQSVGEYQKSNRLDGYPPSPLTPRNIADTKLARFCIYLYLHHLWERDIDFTVLDVGSHIGDFSLKVGNFIRTFDRKTQVVAFDPTEAGALVGYNIELNGLSEIVRYENLAIADFEGLMLFSYSPGFSDSTHFAERDADAAQAGGGGGGGSRLEKFLQKPFREKVASVKWKITSNINNLVSKPEVHPSYNFIARGTDIQSYLERNNNTGNLFVKIDIEGFDMMVIEALLKMLPDRLISFVFEFAPRAFGGAENSVKYLESLNQSFYLFDLFYSPNPTRCRLLGADALPDFVDEISKRKYGYTDVLAVDRRVPESERIAERLSQLTETADEMVL